MPFDYFPRFCKSSKLHRLIGGDGNDTLNPGTGLNDFVDGGAGNDLLVVDYRGVTSPYSFSSRNIERVTFQGSNGVDNLTFGNSTDVLYGNGGNDTLNAGGGNDYLNGGSGYDTLTGGAGNDRIAGTDYVSQGNGERDTLMSGRCDLKGAW